MSTDTRNHTDRFAVRSSRVALPEGTRRAAIVVDGEVIDAVVDPDDLDPDLAVVDVGDAVVMPGLVDCHVHVNEPGRTCWEGFDTATHAAASGGVTTIVDMPLNCLPVTTSAGALENKLHRTEGELWVDTGFWGGVVPGNAEHIAPMAEAGVLGCKAFLVHSGIDEFPNATEEDLREAMPRLRDAGLPLLAHAEIDLGAGPAGGEPGTYGSYVASRPPSWEDAAIELLVRLCRETGCAVHIVHLSAASSLDRLRAARDEGLPITVETCPHYLCLDAEHVPDGATEYKCAPPIRDARNRDALWRGLAEGIIDFVVTDHSPCSPELKQGNFDDAWGGVSSLSLGLPGLWTEAARRGHTLDDLTRWLCREPARFAGLARKGRLAAGCDADLVVWNPDARFEVTPDRLHFRHKHSPYVGAVLSGVVEHTYLRGRRVFDRPAHFSPCPTGRLLLHREETT